MMRPAMATEKRADGSAATPPHDAGADSDNDNTISCTLIHHVHGRLRIFILRCPPKEFSRCKRCASKRNISKIRIEDSMSEEAAARSMHTYAWDAPHAYVCMGPTIPQPRSDGPPQTVQMIATECPYTSQGLSVRRSPHPAGCGLADPDSVCPTCRLMLTPVSTLFSVSHHHPPRLAA